MDFHISSLHYVLMQGSHRLEKCLNVQGCLEKSLKIKFAFKSDGKTLKGLEFYHLQVDSTLSLEI